MAKFQIVTTEVLYCGSFKKDIIIADRYKIEPGDQGEHRPGGRITLYNSEKPVATYNEGSWQYVKLVSED